MSKCAICGKEVLEKRFTPFCSQRCKNVDLNRWFSGTYVIPETESEKNLKNIENLSGQSSEIELYNISESPDSSVGRAED